MAPQPSATRPLRVSTRARTWEKGALLDNHASELERSSSLAGQEVWFDFQARARRIAALLVPFMSIRPPYGPPAVQEDGRSMLRPYSLGRIYPGFCLAAVCPER